MAFFKKSKKDQKVQVDERKQNTLQNAAAAAAFAEAGEFDTARSMLANGDAAQKILVICKDNIFSKALMDYAIDMAGRLEYELVAVNVIEAPLFSSAEKRAEKVRLFQEECLPGINAFKAQAAESNVSFESLVELGSQDAVLGKIHNQFPGLRYVLSEPDAGTMQYESGKVTIPVFDLGCFQESLA